MRVWLTDRPGAFARLATVISEIGGDLVGIDILERGEGRAIDELTIDLAGIEDLFETFVNGIAQTFFDWAALVDPDGSVVLARSPGAPSDAWLGAFVAGARLAAAAPGSANAASDVAWATLEISGLALLVGRAGRPFRARERRQLATLALVADHRWGELVIEQSKRSHP